MIHQSAIASILFSYYLALFALLQRLRSIRTKGWVSGKFVMRMLSVIVCTAFIQILVSLPAIAGTKPNIIFLFSDDQRADTIGAHGNPYIQTPNLDQLAENGFSFRRNYCAGSFSGAVCVASRAMLMTGRSWKRIPSENPTNDWSNLPLLPSVLESKGGCRTFIIGKWHNGKATLQRAFSSGQSVYIGGMANHESFEVQDLVNGELTAKRDAGGFSSEVYADAAVEFIQKADSDRPFFLYVAFMAPHDPRMPPEKNPQIFAI
jgi:arylsulfatase A-like enzyme